MAPPILILRDVRLAFGGTPLLDGVAFQIQAGERLCLLGRNGSGKSTLLRIAAGQIEPDSGERFVQPGTTIRYLSQEPDLSGYSSTQDYVADGLAPGDDPHQARQLLEGLGLNGGEDPAILSGGEIRRCALARTLAPRPDILILDEPTNHLDLPGIEWLETTLAGLRAAIVLVSHDRRFLARLSRATLWLDRGKARRLERGFEGFEEWRDEILEQEERNRQKLDRKIARETEWLHKGVTARRKRNQGRLRALRALREERSADRRAAGAVGLAGAEAERSGDMVIEAKSLSKAFAGRPLVRGLSLRLKRGDRLGIIGPNGAGKTTLLNLLTGKLAPDEGRVRAGAKLEIAATDQQRESLDPATTLADALTGGNGDTVIFGHTSRHVIGYMKDLLFAPEQRLTPLGALSGGERGRVMIARAMAGPSNLLVLDEPTNDLDLETLDVVQEMIADYDGTVLLVSHDRDFLDRVVTSVLAFEGDGSWIEYAGGYTDMLAQRSQAEPAAPLKPRARPAPKPKPAHRPAKKRLSFAEHHALKTLPERIEALQSEIAVLRARLADPALFGRDRDGFETAAGRLEQAEVELAASEDEWLALELKREAIEGA